MKLRVSLWNSIAELDHKITTSEQDAAKLAIEMIESAGELRPGDEIRVQDVE